MIEDADGAAPDGWQWVPTAQGVFGELTDWRLVRQEVAHEWDVRRWRPWG